MRHTNELLGKAFRLRAANLRVGVRAGNHLLKPAAVFDAQEMHSGWSVLVTGDKIPAVATLAIGLGAALFFSGTFATRIRCFPRRFRDVSCSGDT